MVLAQLKKAKLPSLKARLHMSTVGVKIQRLEDVEEDEVVIIENEPIAMLSYVVAMKKQVVYITSYSRLGLVWGHVFKSGKTAEAATVVEQLQLRITQAIQLKSKVPATGIEQMSAGFDDDDDDGEVGPPAAKFRQSSHRHRARSACLPDLTNAPHPSLP